MRLTNIFKYILFLATGINSQTANSEYNLIYDEKNHQEKGTAELIGIFKNNSQNSIATLTKINYSEYATKEFAGVLENCSEIKSALLLNEQIDKANKLASRSNQANNNPMAYCQWAADSYLSPYIRKNSFKTDLAFPNIKQYTDIDSCYEAIQLVDELIKSITKNAINNCRIDFSKRQKEEEEIRKIAEKKATQLKNQEIKEFRENVSKTSGPVYITKKTALIGQGDEIGREMQSLLTRLHNEWRQYISDWLSYSAMYSTGNVPMPIIIELGKSASAHRESAISLSKEFENTWNNLPNDYLSNYVSTNKSGIIIFTINSRHITGVFLSLDEFGNLYEILGEPLQGIGSPISIYKSTKKSVVRKKAAITSIELGL